MVKASLFLVLVGAILLVSSSPLGEDLNIGAIVDKLPIVDTLIPANTNPIGCDININKSCPENSTWKLGKPCANGCGQEDATCPEECACICNDGYRLLEGKCVKKESCP